MRRWASIIRKDDTQRERRAHVGLKRMVRKRVRM
jgi:hypothetical protein